MNSDLVLEGKANYFNKDIISTDRILGGCRGTLCAHFKDCLWPLGLLPDIIKERT